MKTFMNLGVDRSASIKIKESSSFCGVIVFEKHLVVNFMAMLPPGIKESYGIKCVSCSYRKIIHGEKKWQLNPMEALLRIMFNHKCPNCGGKIVKDNSIIIH